MAPADRGNDTKGGCQPQATVANRLIDKQSGTMKALFRGGLHVSAKESEPLTGPEQQKPRITY
jgi:hypothetical protein